MTYKRFKRLIDKRRRLIENIFKSIEENGEFLYPPGNSREYRNYINAVSVLEIAGLVTKETEMRESSIGVPRGQTIVKPTDKELTDEEMKRIISSRWTTALKDGELTSPCYWKQERYPSESNMIKILDEFLKKNEWIQLKVENGLIIGYNRDMAKVGVQVPPHLEKIRDIIELSCKEKVKKKEFLRCIEDNFSDFNLIKHPTESKPIFALADGLTAESIDMLERDNNDN